MAPERIFQGRQRGILELAEGKSHLYPQSRQSSHLGPAFGKICLQPFSTCPNRETHTPKHRFSVPPPAPVGRRAGPTTPLQSAHRGALWAKQTPGIDPRKGAPLPLPLPERLVLASSDFQKMPDRPQCRGAAGKRPRWPRALPGEPGTFLTAAARGCQRAQTEFGFRSVPQWRCALAGGADVLTASAPLRSPWVSPRWRRLLCQECESFRFPLGIKANHK